MHVAAIVMSPNTARIHRRPVRRSWGHFGFGAASVRTSPSSPPSPAPSASVRLAHSSLLTYLHLLQCLIRRKEELMPPHWSKCRSPLRVGAAASTMGLSLWLSWPSPQYWPSSARRRSFLLLASARRDCLARPTAGLRFRLVLGHCNEHLLGAVVHRRLAPSSSAMRRAVRCLLLSRLLGRVPATLPACAKTWVS